MDVDISQTGRHGRWGVDTCEGVYSAPLAREAMRGLSGHPPKFKLFHLSHACADPSESLQRQIFPEADVWLHRIVHGEECENNLAAQGFLNLLIQLRKILLQDAAVLYSLLPPSITSHRIFAEFQQFRHDLLQRMQDSTNPVEKNLLLAMPLLSKQLEA